jgi:hypothetical protein
VVGLFYKRIDCEESSKRLVPEIIILSEPMDEVISTFTNIQHCAMTKEFTTPQLHCKELYNSESINMKMGSTFKNVSDLVSGTFLNKIDEEQTIKVPQV